MSPADASQNLAARLLVVDDDENNRDMLARRLMRRGFEVAVAVDGNDAVAKIDANDSSPFDLVLLDIEMPGMNGFDVLKHVRQTRAATRLPVIVATARSDREDIVQALGFGANDYVTKPLDFPVVLARVESHLSHKRAIDRIVALEEEVRKHNDELKAANARMRHSLEMAARVQQSLLPSAGPLRIGEKTTFAWAFNPCDELGGDIFNAFALGEDRVGIYLLDVSGHGVPAALLSVTLSRVLACNTGAASLVEQVDAAGISSATPPAKVIAELNQRFPMDSGSLQYFTIFYGVFDCQRRELRYVSAGHPPALLMRASGKIESLAAHGYAVGWFADAEVEEHSITLGPGDRLFVYSDGLTEMRAADSKLFGDERLISAIEREKSQPIQQQINAILRAVKVFGTGHETMDDLTMIALEYG